MIRSNLQWEQIRYLSAMVYNVNCTKKSQMILPDKLFPLPQDTYLDRGKPKSDIESFMDFKKKIKKAKTYKNKEEL